MKLITVAAVTSTLLALALGQSVDATMDPLDVLDLLTEQAMQNLNSTLSDAGKARKCHPGNVAVRRDWRSFSQGDRRDYIDAVRCLMEKPAQSDESWASAARTRYDDFTALHVNQTQFVHVNGRFLTWHRYLVWAYEKALKDECGYKGEQPYWNWFADAKDIYSSPIFDGSNTSFGGDGEFFQHNGSLAGGRTVYIPSGKGGGCVKDNPFADFPPTLGPISPAMDGMTGVPDGLHSYNPRCLRRDLSPHVGANFFTTQALIDILVGKLSKTMKLFNDGLSGDYPNGVVGLHTAGHYFINGDGADLYTSPVDPAFYMHHTMLDRVYWLWQLLNPEEAETVSGTLTTANKPPSRDATPDDDLDMGILAETVRIRDMFDTVGDHLCYIYL